MDKSTKKKILIVGAGEFGLSTALALLKRQSHADSHIEILESSHTLPNPHGSSVDASRIIRADYAHKTYASLASQAQVLWRDTSETGWGGQGRYSETGFVLTAHEGRAAYVDGAMENVRALAAAGLPIDLGKIEQLKDRAAIRKATGYEGVSGDRGYANWNSGWAHAEKVVQYAMEQVKRASKGRVTLRTGVDVQSLLVEDGKCRGVRLATEDVLADLTVLATGAWTPSLVDLEGRALATGQALAYIGISPDEQAEMQNRPVIMNLSNGMFIIPPTGGELKIARHAFGYLHPHRARFYDGAEKDISAPKPEAELPADAHAELRQALREIVPSMADRPFTRTRLCWYTDTPDGDFLIDRHPECEGLVLATGGSGHGFKFFPIIGEKIVDRIDNVLDTELAELWKWKAKQPGFLGCNDGSRSGFKGGKI